MPLERPTLVPVRQFEEHVFEIEGVILYLRTSMSTEVPDYPYSKKLGDHRTVADLEKRISRHFKDHNISIEFEFVDPNGERTIPIYSRKILKSLRQPLPTKKLPEKRRIRRL